MDYKKYTSAGVWYEDARKDGYRPSCVMMHGITQTMKKLDLSFPQAFQLLEEHKKIFLSGKLYIFDLSYAELWKKNSQKN
jgi:hypothetical protein